MKDEEQLVGMRTDFSDARHYVLENITSEAALLTLIEECSELIQAAMKRYRSITDGNPTPVTPEKAWQMMMEETGDVLMVFDAFGLLNGDVSTEYNPKWLRWARRLGYEGS